MHITEFLIGVLRRSWLVVLLGGAMAVAGYVYSSGLPRTYASSALLMVGQSLTANQTYNEVLAAQRLTQTYARLAGTRLVAERVVETLGLDRDPVSIQEAITTEAPIDGLFVTLTVRDRDPDTAADIANAAAEALIAMSPTIPVPEPGTGPGRRLVALVDAAVPPTSPEGPRNLLNTLIAAGTGVASALVLIFVLELADDSVRGRRRIEERLGLPVLAEVTAPSTPSGSDGREAIPGLLATDLRDLAVRIEFALLGTDSRVVAVAGPGPGDGAKTIAINLARAFAAAGHRSLLVDGDLHQPTLHEVFGVRNSVGLSNVLRGATPPGRAVVATSDSGLAVLPGGPPASDAAALASSARVGETVDWTRSVAAFVIVATPPLLVVPDGAHLSRACDATLVAVTPKTALSALRAAIDVVTRGQGNPIGVVIVRSQHTSRLGAILARRPRLPWPAPRTDDSVAAAQPRPDRG